MDKISLSLTIPAKVDPLFIAGVHDEIFRVVEEYFAADLSLGEGCVRISALPIDLEVLTTFFTELFEQVKDGDRPNAHSVRKTIELLRDDAFAPRTLRDDVILTYGARVVRPKTAGQKCYVDAMRSHTITFGIGPAGTGKTYLAMAMAIAALERKEVSHIILARPVVEAGEGLGFLPGTVEEKVDPYMRPLYDALFSMMDRSRAYTLIENATIEIAPLAYMRGRTLSDAFVILDEAQNTTPEQMKMFLTRLGFGSTFVVTGDLTQTDLPRTRSALSGIRSILDTVEGIAFVELDSCDVVRHGLVSKIVGAYEAAQQGTACRTTDGQETG